MPIRRSRGRPPKAPQVRFGVRWRGTWRNRIGTTPGWGWLPLDPNKAYLCHNERGTKEPRSLIYKAGTFYVTSRSGEEYAFLLSKHYRLCTWMAYDDSHGLSPWDGIYEPMNIRPALYHGHHIEVTKLDNTIIFRLRNGEKIYFRFQPHIRICFNRRQSLMALGIPTRRRLNTGNAFPNE